MIFARRRLNRLRLQRIMDTTLTQELREGAHALGFDAFGVCAVAVELKREYYLDWIHCGKHGAMGWMERNNERRLYPQNIIEQAHSIVVVGLNYYQPNPRRRGRIAKYALGLDYHRLMYRKLQRLCTVMQGYGGQQRPYVDTGPILEKPIAALAGLGWQGKSTILLNQKQGTWMFLGVIVTTLELKPDGPAIDRCGSCTRCIEACPTQAITAPYQLDARKCIAYLTIEHPGPIPMAYRQAIGDRIFGCDECLDVCPWNRWAVATRESKLLRRDYPDLRVMLNWSEQDFEDHFRGTAIKRTGLHRWWRNICIVLGNIGTREDLADLRAKFEDTDPVVAESAQWAIQQITQRDIQQKTE